MKEIDRRKGHNYRVHVKKRFSKLKIFYYLSYIEGVGGALEQRVIVNPMIVGRIRRMILFIFFTLPER